MHREVVERKGWCDDARFLRGLNFCLLLPGPEAHQLVTWLGWRMHGPVGGLAAGLLFVLPGALVMYALTLAYLHFERAPAMEGALYGLRAVVVALVGQALFRMAKRVLRDTPRRVLAVLACGALLCDVPYPWVVGLAALAGFVCFRPHPVPTVLKPVLIEHHVVRPVTILGVLQTLVIGLTLWWGPVLAAGVLLGPDHRLVREGLYFGRLATLSFGGAYAVLAWIRQEAVEDLGWLSTREMADALSLAETTPGPLILVTQFVGSLAAARHPEPLSPLWAATLGAFLTTWVTFAPSFLWIALGRDWVDRVPETSPASRAMDGVSAAVVGVIATLGLSLAHQAFFVSASHPVPITPRIGALLIGLGAAIALVRGRPGLGWVLLASVLAGPVARTLDG